MNSTPKPLRALVPAGFATWALVGLPQLVSLIQTGTLTTMAGLGWLASFAAFGLFFFLSTRDWCRGRSELALVALQSVAALAGVFFQPYGFQPVLLVIVAVQLGEIPIRAALAWIVAQSALLGVALVGYETYSPLAMTLAYVGFQLFGIFVTRIAHKEHEARRALAERNAELRVATGLLEINSRTEERLRIARDLHDLLGHHLTALSLNLEVASHLTTGAAREQIHKSQGITRILLTDVREVVGRLRDREPVDVGKALASLRDSVHSPALRIEGESVRVDDPVIAQTLLRAMQEVVTNAIRHSGARNLWLSLKDTDGAVQLIARDDGSGTDQVELGSGLKGMRERVGEAGGSLEVASSRGGGFEVRIALPKRGAAA
jgi:signal transduction histidine kinase